MSDIFGYNREPKPAGVLSHENSTLVIGSAAGAGLASLVQNFQISYQQQVTEVYELGSNRLFWKKGRPVGQGNITRLIGANNGLGIKQFSQDALDVCQGGATMELTVGGGNCIGSSPVRIRLTGVVVSSVGISSETSDPQVVEGIGWRFSTLEAK